MQTKLPHFFLDRKRPPLPPFGNFPKIHPFWCREASLSILPPMGRHGSSPQTPRLHGCALLLPPGCIGSRSGQRRPLGVDLKGASEEITIGGRRAAGLGAAVVQYNMPATTYCSNTRYQQALQVVQYNIPGGATALSIIRCTVPQYHSEP